MTPTEHVPTPTTPPRGPTLRFSGTFTGTTALTALAMHRSKVLLPVWVAVISVVVVSLPRSLAAVYTTADERADVAATMNANTSLRALYGPVFGDSLGALTAWRIGGMAGVLAAVMSMAIVVRHTRGEEEAGRQELLCSAMVGRRAHLTAALATAFAANAAIAALVTVGLAGHGVGGAVALGCGIAGTGMVFATVAAVAAQITASARTARGITAAALGAAFALRAAGDASANDGTSPLTWVSPVGWLVNTRSFAGERWWTLLLFPMLGLALACAAYVLAGRRDIGGSLVAPRTGPAAGRLRTAGALAVRLHRGALAGWCTAFLVAGTVFGSMADGASDLVGDNEQTRDIFERMGGQADLTDSFLASIAGILGMVAALFTVAAVLRLRDEETSQRAEPLLAAALTRLRWAGGHLVVAFAGAGLVMLAAGAGMSAGHRHDIGRVLGACLIQLPAIWLITALAVLTVGVAPRAAKAAWAVAGLVLLIGWLGPALDLPGAVMNLSPFSHLPKLPGDAMTWTPAIALTALAAAATAAGLAGLRRRDIGA